MTELQDFTQDQLINLVHNTIRNKTEYAVSQMTGGNVQLTCAGGTSCKIINCKVMIYFGYDKSRNNRKFEEETDITLIEIWIKAIYAALQLKKVEKNGNLHLELNKLMNTPSPAVKGTEVNNNDSDFGLGIGTKLHDEDTSIVQNMPYTYDEIPS